MNLTRIRWSRIELVSVVGFIMLVFAIGLGVWGYSRLHSHFDLEVFLQDFYANLTGELGSIGITVIVIDQLNRRREKTEQQRREIEDFKRLQRQYEVRLRHVRNPTDMRSLLIEMDVLNVLNGSDLAGLDLKGINLGKPAPGTILDPVWPVSWDRQPGRIDLRKTKLDSTNFEGGSLKSVDLREVHALHTNFKDADLSFADLSSAFFGYAYMSGANLTEANLEATRFSYSTLSEANFTNANLRNVDFHRTSLYGVVLPDGSILTDSNSEQIARFTDPNHPHFWQPKWLHS
jgi:uncharacterized protein YjbI with pentapeptide repeats